MKRARILILSCVMLVAVAAGAMFLSSCNPTRVRATYLERLKLFVSRHEVDLTNHASAVLEGRVARRGSLMDFLPPTTNGIDKRVLAVTCDTNRNVYFILSDSFTTFDVGIIYSKTGPPFPGYSAEPRIVTNIHLFSDWYYYKAR